MPVLHVEPGGQAVGKLEKGDLVLSINGANVRGNKMAKTAEIVVQHTSLKLDVTRG